MILALLSLAAGDIFAGKVQALQQLIGQSPWPWAPVWERLDLAAKLAPNPAWVIDGTGFPKKDRQRAC